MRDNERNAVIASECDRAKTQHHRPDPRANDHEGYHRFREPGTHHDWGSFEVWWSGGATGRDGHGMANTEEPGWYWWTCFPGCMPDGESNGPFRTSYLAYVDARGGA